MGARRKVKDAPHHAEAHQTSSDHQAPSKSAFSSEAHWRPEGFYHFLIESLWYIWAFVVFMFYIAPFYALDA
jgi:hypothetical protein